MRLRWNWGTGIAAVYTAFACATAGFVVFAMDNPPELVSPDYYARSLRQDERIEARRNAARLDGGAGVVVDDRSGDLIVRLPAAHAADASGAVTLYRPSSAGADRVIALRVDAAGTQRISHADLSPGKWIAQLSWTSAGRTFYLEQAVNTP